MKLPHLLRVEAGAERFAPLLAAAREAGLRVGWLELDAALAAPPELEAAAALGVLRAVAAGPARSIAVKPRRGAPVLKDLLREHFIGCGLVLVRTGGAMEAPALRPAGAGEGEAVWEIELPAAAPRRYATGELVAALRRPRPFLQP